MADIALQQIVNALATRLSRSVAIDDPAIRLLVASRHFGDEDPARLNALLHREMPAANRRFALSHGIARWTQPGRMPANPELGALERVCVPVRRHGMLLGYLWLIDPDETLAVQELTWAAETAENAAVVLYRELLLQESSRSRAESMLRQLLSDSAETRCRAGQVITADRLLRSDRHVAVMVVEVMPGADTDPERHDVAARRALENALAALPPKSTLHYVDGSRLVLLVATATPVGYSLADVAEGMRSQLVAGGSGRTTVGIGSLGAGLAHAVVSYEQACLADRAGGVVPSLGDIVEWDRLGSYALLLRLAPADLSTIGYPACLGRLLAADRSGKLLATVETFLDEGGDPQRTAAALQIHRTTMYYRLRRAQDIAGVDLDRGEDRLTMHMGIRLARLSGALPSASADHDRVRLAGTTAGLAS